LGTVPLVRHRPATVVALVCAVVVAVVVAGCDISQSARTGPVDELSDVDRPYAAPVGAVVAADLPDGLRPTFDVECLGAAYLLGFGREQLLVADVVPADVTAASFRTEGPTDVDVDTFISSIEQCGDVRVYALLVGGTRFSTAPLTEVQLRCAAAEIDRARGSELLRATLVVDETVDDAERGAATREIVALLRDCGAPMTDVG
jgi:hypothetical protein